MIHLIKDCRCEGKICRLCMLKCINAFGTNKKAKDGLRSECYACRKRDYQAHAEINRERARQYRQNNAKEIAERDKSSRLANPGREKASRHAQYLRNAEAIKSKQKEYRQANPDKIRQQKRKYVLSYPERVRSTWKRCYDSKPDLYLEISRVCFARRRARKSKVDGSFTRQEWQHLKDQHINKCLCCGKDNVKLTPDHVIPLAKNGSNDISNIQPLCLPCNLSKGTKIIDYRR